MCLNVINLGVGVQRRGRNMLTCTRLLGSISSAPSKKKKEEISQTQLIIEKDEQDILLYKKTRC